MSLITATILQRGTRETSAKNTLQTNNWCKGFPPAQNVERKRQIFNLNNKINKRIRGVAKEVKLETY